MTEHNLYHNPKKLADYLAYKFRCATGDEGLTVTAGKTLRSDNSHLRTVFTVKLSDHNLNRFTPEMLNLRDNQFPRIFGVISDDSRKERMGYAHIQNGVFFPYLFGDPTELVGLAQSRDASGWRAARAKLKVGQTGQQSSRG